MKAKKKTPPTNSKLKTKVGLLLKISFIGTLLYYLVQKGFISIEATQAALTQWEMILPAALAIAFANFLGVFRWQWLLQAQNIHLKWTKVFQLTLIGNFFNIALPGAVSGDFVKAFYVGKVTQGEKAKALGSILFDRVAGVSALVLVSATALALGFETYADSMLFKGIQILLLTGATCVLGFYGYLFLVKEKHDPFLISLNLLKKKLPAFDKALSTIIRLYTSLRHYHNHRFTVLRVLAISAVIHMTIGWTCYQFAHALGVNDLSLLSLYVVVPLGLLVTAVPVAPGGIGTGNIAFLYFFKLIGCQRGADIYSLLALCQISISSLGGIAYFFNVHSSGDQTEWPELPEANSL